MKTLIIGLLVFGVSSVSLADSVYTSPPPISSNPVSVCDVNGNCTFIYIN